MPLAAPGEARPTLLSPLLVLTDRSQVPAGRSLLDQVRSCIDGGARAIVLREKDLPRGERRALAEPLLSALAPVDGVLIIASDRYLAADVGAHGVHTGADTATYWRAADPASSSPPPRAEHRHLRSVTQQRGPLPVWGMSVHPFDDLDDVVEVDPDYVTISPVHASASKPGYGPALGPDGLRSFVASWRDTVWADRERALLPRVYALGGIESPELAAECVGLGASGVAVMGALMRADDPAATTAAMLAALSPGARA